MDAPKSKGGLKPGLTVLIGGEEYTAPQLNFGALRRMRQLPSSPTYADDLVAFVLVESLSRNYEGINALWLNDTLEGTEVDGAAKAAAEIMRNSGLKGKDEAQSSGNVEAVTGS
jgi:hypothetical protein